MRIIGTLATLVAAGLLASACPGQSEKAASDKQGAAKASKKKNADKASKKKARKQKAKAKADAAKKAKADEKAKETAEKIAKSKERIAEFEKDAATEAIRWDDALRAGAKKLAETKHRSTRSGLRAALAGKHRAPGNSDRDKYRHPLKTLAFFGLKPDSHVIEVGAGAGWYTELLAPLLAASGKLTVLSADPKGPLESGATPYARRLELLLKKSPELFGKVAVQIVAAPDKLNLGPDASADLVLAARELHGWQRREHLQAYAKAILKVLKPGGVFGVVQHRAKEGGDPKQTVEKGRLAEPYVIDQLTAAGFVLEKKSEINANPKDSKDYKEGVWTLPPAFALEEKDKDKYLAIGESDRMTLRFVKPKK
ncbi:MAG: methyltransferase domain-containing protein [Nannocystaceae bacterium]